MDETLFYVKRGSMEYVLSVRNLFHENIKFTHEQWINNRLPFLDVLFTRDHEKINTTVFKKDTHNDRYLQWQLLLTNSWK